MEVNCTSPHEHNINGYSTHVTALFPEHVRAMYMLECTSPKEELNEYFGKFTGYDGIYVNDYKRMLVAFVTEIFHANFMNETTTTKKALYRVVYQWGASYSGGILWVRCVYVLGSAGWENVLVLCTQDRWPVTDISKQKHGWMRRENTDWLAALDRKKKCLKLQRVIVLPNQRHTVRLQPSSKWQWSTKFLGGIS